MNKENVKFMCSKEDSDEIISESQSTDEQDHFCDHCGDKIVGPVFCTSECQIEYVKLNQMDLDASYEPSEDREDDMTESETDE